MLGRVSHRQARECEGNPQGAGLDTGGAGRGSRLEASNEQARGNLPTSGAKGQAGSLAGLGNRRGWRTGCYWLLLSHGAENHLSIANLEHAADLSPGLADHC